MNIKEIKEMLQLMNENQLTELELEKEGMKIRLKKGPSASAPEDVSREYSAVSSHVPARPAEIAEVHETPKGLPAGPPKLIVKSPMVGTFYAAPAPDAPAFVQIGSQVEMGQVICVIEAMKLMNEIKAEVRGKVIAINVNNGDPVEFGQPLFVLE